MSVEAKRIKGHGGGTNLDWLCVKHKNEGFGFGDEPAIVCVDMTVHAPEVGKPIVVFSTYEVAKISPDLMKYQFGRGAYDTWEQVEFARRIVTGWDKIRSGDKIELDYAQPTPEKRYFRR
jgi:hypothetical protein